MLTLMKSAYRASDLNSRYSFAPYLYHFESAPNMIVGAAFSVIVSASVISFVPFSSAKNFLQSSQTKYSILPFDIAVDATAGIFLRFTWLPELIFPYFCLQ